MLSLLSCQPNLNIELAIYQLLPRITKAAQSKYIKKVSQKANYRNTYYTVLNWVSCDNSLQKNMYVEQEL